MPNIKLKELIRFQLKWNFLTVELMILFIADIILLNLPLTNILGYEYSAANAIFVSLLSGLFAIHLLKQGIFQRREDTSFFFNRVFNGNFYLILLPFILSIIAAIFVRNCSLFYGILFYLIITVPSVLVGTSLALLCYFSIPRFSRVAFILVFLLILSLPSFEIYFNPQIYFFNPIIGYYPGTIYDESLTIEVRLFIYRVLNILFFGAIALFVLKSISLKKQFSSLSVLSFTGAIIFIAGIFTFFESSLGFSTTESRMKSELSGNLETDHFSIYFDKKIGRKNIENLALLHEYYYQEVVHYLNAEPKSKITSFLFFNARQKKGLLGSEAADVAMPWKYQIFINYENFDETLKHEIAHCVAADFGVTPFRMSAGFNPSLLEGIATAADNKYNYNTIHYMAALAYNNGYRFPIESMLNGFNFFGQVSSLSYIYSGSFIRFLIERYGIENFKKIYQGENYNSVYSKTLGDLAKEYYYFIGSLNLAINRKDEANYYFGRQTIFKKVCARYMASKTEDGWELYNQGNYDESKQIFEDLLNYSDSYQALLGYIYNLKKLDDIALALAVLNQNLPKFQSTSYYYNLELIKGDMAVSNRDFYDAENVYRSLFNQNPSKDYRSLSAFRTRIIVDTSTISHYVNGSDYDKYSVLRKLNSDSVFTASIPLMISLSEKLNENYSDFINFIKNRLNAYDLISSYACLRVSKFALKRNDFQNARLFAITARNYKIDKDFSEILDQNQKMVDWFLYSSDLVRYNLKWQSY